MLKISTNTSSLKFLALELKADLVEWLVNVLVSISDKLKTVMIHLDIVDVDTPRCGPMKLKRSCGSVLCYTFVYFKYKSI